MTLATYNPNLIELSGYDQSNVEDSVPAGGAITPGMLVEFYLATTLKLRANGTAAGQATLCVALSQHELNKGVDVAYAAGEPVKAWFLRPGNKFWGLIPSGQTINAGDFLQSNGDGKLKAATATTAAANVARFQALTSPGAVTADTRVVVQVVC